MPQRTVYKRERGDFVGTNSIVYEHMRPRWEIILDLLEGTSWMREQGVRYLPQEPLESPKAYEIRLGRTFLYNGLKKALGRVSSQPFRKKVQVQNIKAAPERIRDYLETNLDGRGKNLTEFAQELYRAMTALGHAFIFVDFTAVKDILGSREASVADVEKIGARGIWKILRAPDMLDWHHENVNGVDRLVMVKFREVRVERVGNWSNEEREYIHVWRNNAEYTEGTFEIYKADKPVEYHETILGTHLNTWTPPENLQWAKEFTLVKEGTHTYPGIPVVPVYANRTNEFTSVPPYIELANTNIEHWQSSSDQRNILRFARLAQKVITGAGRKEVTAAAAASVHNMITLKDPQAKAYYLEHSGAGIEAGEKDLDRLELRMDKQGEQKMTQRSLAPTATGSMLDMLDITSDAEAWVGEVELGIRKAVEVDNNWTDAGVEVPQEVKIDIHSDFTLAISNKEDFRFLDTARSRGDVSQKTLLLEMQRRNMLSEALDIEVELEDTKEEMSVAPAGFEDDPTAGRPGAQEEESDEDE